jgi:hypothetical protein
MESVAANALDRPDKTLRLASKMPEIFTTIAIKTFSMTKQLIQDDTVDKANVLGKAATVDVLVTKWTRLLNVPVDTLHQFGQSVTVSLRRQQHRQTRFCGEVQYSGVKFVLVSWQGIVVFFSLMSVHKLVLKVLPRLFRLLDGVLPDALAVSKASIIQRYADLSVGLTSSLVQMKAEPIMGVIEKEMNDFGLDWKRASEPRGTLSSCGGGHLHSCAFFLTSN